jgi:predicted ribosome quality control (RQC) complex YloA/Tae2 family protein
MDDGSIKAVVAELKRLLIGHAPGKIFQLGPWSIAIDFGLREHGYLLISADPSLPRIHLITRRVRDLEKQSSPLGQFALVLRKHLSGTTLRELDKDTEDRIVRFRFVGVDELAQTQTQTLVAQLTGRSANLFLLDRDLIIIQCARSQRFEGPQESTHPFAGQEIGTTYQPPPSVRSHRSKSERILFDTIQSGEFSSASAAADAYFTSLLSQRAFESRASTARANLRKKVSRQKHLIQQLQRDLSTHVDAQQHKRIGDLLLANVGTAKRQGNRVSLIDYFAEDAQPLEIEIDEQLSLQQEATRRFELYSRSKRALSQINSRLAAARAELEHLKSQEQTLEEIIERRDEAALAQLSGPSPSAVGPLREPGSVARSSTGQSKRIPGTRRYLSSDGFEILVGRAARDNDHLTFKVAKPNDLWLHAADYGGSHVVVRNSTRKEIPHRTIIEAAQLAAHFSQAKKDPKVDVHYTQRKFISKSKGAKPGLVRMSRFKTIVVEPKEMVRRTDERI